MSALGNKVFARFKKVGKTVFRLTDDDATVFASRIQACFSELVAFSSLCIAPNALNAEVTDAVLRRWLLAAPGLLPVARALSNKVGEPAHIKEIDSETLVLFNSRVLQIALDKGQLPEKVAKDVAFHLTECASAFFALEQACMGCEDYLLKELAAILRRTLSGPLEHAIAAKALYFGATR